MDLRHHPVRYERTAPLFELYCGSVVQELNPCFSLGRRAHQPLCQRRKWWERMGSNHRRAVLQTAALSLSYIPAPEAGIEPATKELTVLCSAAELLRYKNLSPFDIKKPAPVLLERATKFTISFCKLHATAALRISAIRGTS